MAAISTGPTVQSQWTRLLTVTVENAKDLKNVDWIGSSDPFFIIEGFNGKVIGGNDGGDKGISKVIDNNLHPEWQETHLFLLDKQVDRFKVTIKDKGTVAAMSKVIGTAVVSLDTEHQTIKEFPLDTQGSVFLKFRVTHLGDVMP